MIYKICPADLWAQAERTGVFEGSPHDKADGFIHFSVARQVPGTLAKYYAGQDGLLLIAINESGLTGLIYEPARGGVLFPHLYRPLPLKHVVWQKPLTRDASGAFVLPEEMGV
jgi:uncharacterized protein (DUF952 family)